MGLSGRTGGGRGASGGASAALGVRTSPARSGDAADEWGETGGDVEHRIRDPIFGDFD